MSTLFEVSDKYELLALHRVLFEAKYHPAPENPEITGNPLVAAMSLRIVDALAGLDEPGVGGEGWREWQKVERHEHRLPIIRSRLLECHPWPKWSKDEKRKYVQLLLAPLVADEATLTALVDEADQHHRE